MNQLENRIILCGRTSSGKTTIKDLLVRLKGLKPEISYTTRDPRPHEIDGKDYHFISRDNFVKMIVRKEFIQHVEFKDNYYGTSVADFAQVMIMTPSGINLLQADIRKKCHVFLIDVPSHVIKSRFESRGFELDVITERIEADEKDFNGFIGFDYKLNGTKKPSDIIDDIYTYINSYPKIRS